MVFNNEINHLKLWCIHKAESYQQKCAGYGGVYYVGYQVAYELEFKLSTLIDKSFESVNELREEVLNLIYIHYEPSVLKPPNSAAKHIIDKTNQEFFNYFEEVIPQMKALSLAEIRYKRVIVGAEAIALKEKFRLIWQYVNTSYWFPLMGEEPTEISEKFFIMYDFFEPYVKQLEQIIGLPQVHIYSFGENIFRPEHCIETTELIEYGGCETIYTDKGFSWAIYFSHEGTISYAGSIVPIAKKLLLAEKEHWNRFEWNEEE